MEDYKKYIKCKWTTDGNLTKDWDASVELREYIVNILNDLIDVDCIELAKNQEELKESLIKIKIQ